MIRVLVCEDEEIVLKAVVYKLQNDGFSVMSAADGREGLRCINEKEFDIIISDILMPYHSGMEILAYLRNDLQKDTPFVFLSTVGGQETVDLAYDIGTNFFMQKPFDIDELVMVIKSLLPDDKFSLV